MSTREILRSPSAHGEMMLMATLHGDVSVLKMYGVERSGMTFLICQSFGGTFFPLGPDISHEAWRSLEGLPGWMCMLSLSHCLWKAIVYLPK